MELPKHACLLFVSYLSNIIDLYGSCQRSEAFEPVVGTGSKRFAMRSSQKNNSISTSSCLIHIWQETVHKMCNQSYCALRQLVKDPKWIILKKNLVKRVIIFVEQSKLKPFPSVHLTFLWLHDFLFQVLALSGVLDEMESGWPQWVQRLWETITDGREETRCSLRSWIDEFPPLHQPMRFGNKAFRSWKGSSGGKDGCKFDGILSIIYIIYYIYIDSHFIHVMQLLNLIFEASETMWAKRSIASASFGCCPQFSVFANELNLPLGLKSGGF